MQIEWPACRYLKVYEWVAWPSLSVFVGIEELDELGPQR